MAFPDTIPARLMSQGEKKPQNPAYAEKKDGAWVVSTWGDYRKNVRQAARALISLGFAPGQTVCILGFNRPEWVLLDIAAMSAGGAPAGIYTTCSAVEVAYILQHSAAQVALVENAKQWEKIKAHLHELPDLKRVVLMRGSEAVDHPMVQTWDAFLATGNAVSESQLDERLAGLKHEDLATLIYTSGTTGPPKAVMLSHRNLTWTADCACGLVAMGPEDICLSYLPLSHIAEQMFTIHAPVTVGGCVYYAESMEKLKDNLAEVRPTVMFGVPRVWEKFYSALNSKFQEATGIKAKLLAWSRQVATQVDALRCENKTPTGFLALQYAIANKLVLGKLKTALGLDRVKVLVSGAAPISKEVLEFFSTVDLPICEVYGQSEDTGPTTFNVLTNRKLGSVGTTLPGVTVKIADDGEILVKGPNVFLGYYKDQAATDETLKDGYLCSGDLGAFDEKGFLSIVGRKKEIIITAGGKNIAPKNIEAALKRNPLIAEAVIIGDRRPYLMALLVLNPDVVAKIPADKLQSELNASVARANEEFARVEHVRRFVVLPRALTEADGELTPTMKLKRKKIASNWAKEIEESYARGEAE